MTRYGSIIYVCRTRGCQSELVLHRDDHLPTPGEWMCPSCEDALEEQRLSAWADAESERAIQRVNFADNWPRPISLEPQLLLVHKKAGA